MLRHQGGDKVKAGFYFNMDSWEVATDVGPGRGARGRAPTARYLRMPLPVLLVFAPLMGACFAMFLPFIGIALVLDFVAKRAWAAVPRRGAGDDRGPEPAHADRRGLLHRRRGRAAQGEGRRRGGSPPARRSSTRSRSSSRASSRSRMVRGTRTVSAGGLLDPDHALADREVNQLGAAVQVELLHQVLAV